MDVVNVVVPNAPTGPQSLASGTPVNPGSPALAKSAGLAAVGAVVAGTSVTGPSAAIDSAAAGLLFGMVLAQLAVVKEIAVKEDAKAADVSQPQAQPSPDQISMLASLVPALVTLQVGPQAVTVPDETSAAEPSGMSMPGLPTNPLEFNAISGTAKPALSTASGKDLNAGRQALVLGQTLPAPQMPVATFAPTLSVALPPTLTQNQAQSVQTFMTRAASAADVRNHSEPTTAHDAGLTAAALSAVAKSDKSPDQSPPVLPASLLIDAMPTDKNRDDLLKILGDKNGSVLELAPAVGDKIPTEFLAARSPSPATLTEVTVPQATAAVPAPAASATITPRETIHLDLGPSDLGRVTVQVSVQSQQVQATVGVEHRGLGEFLAASHLALDQAMRQHGLRLEELHVESILNPDMLGAGDNRTGFLDHGQSREDAPGFMREPHANQGMDNEAIMANADHILEPLGVRYRINLFA